VLTRWRARARHLKRETVALGLAYRHPDVPWYARLVVVCVVAYALSPIDLIPDVIPVLGHLDDLLLVPLGIALAIRLIPPPVMAACRQEAMRIEGRPRSRAAALVIVAIWLLLAAAGVALVVRLVR
jgi:uncharacterized membrane protein YkvA (DUF1232 family)